MAKYPYLKFYASDFYMDTLTWKESEVGTWIRLLCFWWINGPCLPEDCQKVSKNATKMLQKCDKKLKHYPDGRVSSLRLETHRIERQQLSDINRENGLKGGRPQKRTVSESESETKAKQKRTVSETKPSHSHSYSQINKESGKPLPQTVENRKENFRKQVWDIGIVEKEIEPSDFDDFMKYWTEKSPRGRKMRFEKQQVFDIGLRIDTWMKNKSKWNKSENKDWRETDKVLSEIMKNR